MLHGKLLKNFLLLLASKKMVEFPFKVWTVSHLHLPVTDLQIHNTLPVAACKNIFLKILLEIVQCHRYVTGLIL